MEPPNRIDLAAINALSPREKDCLRGVLAHKNTKEIARDLGLSPETVKAHFASIRTKLGVSDRRLAALALEQAGMLPPPDGVYPSEGMADTAVDVRVNVFQAREPVPPAVLREERQPFVPQGNFGMPVPGTRGHRLNSLNTMQRLAAVAAMVLLIMLIVIAAPSMAESVARFVNLIVPPGH